MSLRTAHMILGWTVVFGNGFAGVWALTAHWVEGLRRPVLWWLTALVQTLVGVQVVLGVIFMQSSGIQAPGIHQFYGYVAMLSVALIYSYRLQVEKWRYLLYGLGGLFIMGLALRTVFIPS